MHHACILCVCADLVCVLTSQVLLGAVRVKTQGAPPPCETRVIYQELTLLGRVWRGVR